jgi:hypothetical protein
VDSALLDRNASSVRALPVRAEYLYLPFKLFDLADRGGRSEQ